MVLQEFLHAGSLNCDLDSMGIRGGVGLSTRHILQLKEFLSVARKCICKRVQLVLYLQGMYFNVELWAHTLSDAHFCGVGDGARLR